MGQLNSNLRDAYSNIRTLSRYWYNEHKRLRDERKAYEETLRGSRRIDLALRHDFEESKTIARVVFLGLKDSGRVCSNNSNLFIT